MTTNPTIQQQVDAAMRENHLRETRALKPNPLGDGRKLSLQTAYELHRELQEDEGRYPAASTHGGGAFRHGIIALAIMLLAGNAEARTVYKDKPLRLTYTKTGKLTTRDEGSPSREEIRAANQWLCLFGKPSSLVGIDCRTYAKVNKR